MKRRNTCDAYEMVKNPMALEKNEREWGELYIVEDKMSSKYQK